MTEIPSAVAAELARLRAENARLLKMLELSPRQAAPPSPAQAGFFDAPPGPVHKDSPNDAKVAFFRALFAARTDIYPPESRMPVLDGRAGCRRCAAGGSAGCRMKSGITCR